MTTTALTIKTGQTPTTTDPLQLWDEAVSRYLETRKGGPEGNTAKTRGPTLRTYKDFALDSGLSPWGADTIIAYSKLQNGLGKANSGDLADDTIAARLTHPRFLPVGLHSRGYTPNAGDGQGFHS